MRYWSTSWQLSLPSRIAQTTSDCPRCISPAVNTLFHAGAVVTDLGGNIGSRCGFHAECICHICLCPQKSCGDQHQICVQNLFAALDFFHSHSAGLGIVYRLQLNGFHCTNVILVILDEPLYRCLVDSRIVTKYGNGFFLTVVCLADTGPPGHGLLSARVSGNFGIISSCTTDLQPWRMAVPTQSLPVSPPPMTMTFLYLALI